MKKIFFLILVYLLNTEFLLAKDYISKNPNYIKRGSLWGSAHVANYHKNSKKHNYTIVKDPTGTSPIEIVEKFAPRKGDLKIVFDDNCKYDIFKKNGKILTPGKIKIKNGTKVTYKNKAGSRGKVTLEGDTLTWKNVYTGNNYKIIVNKN